MGNAKKIIMVSKEDLHAAVSIVTWNSEKYIKDLLDSLKAQTFQGFHIIIVDNASTDKTLEIVKEYKGAVVIRNSVNIGFSRAHNKALEMALKFWGGKDLNERFFAVCNPDIVLEPNCLEVLLTDIWRDKSAAAVGPKLLRLYADYNSLESSKSSIIDSMGLKIFKSGRVIDNFSGVKDIQQFSRQEVFGISGAFMCIRVKALLDIKYNKEYFDEDFFAYKEDIDLCWRLRNLGWNIAVNPEAVAYHSRRVGSDAKQSLWQKIMNERAKPAIIKFLSVRNQFWAVWKNNFCINCFLFAPFIFLEECAKFLYCLFFNFGALRAYFAAIGGLFKMLKKRKYLKNAKIKPAEDRKWMK